MSSNGRVQPRAETVVVAHSSPLVADVLARALALAGVSCRVGFAAGPREVLIGNGSGAHLELGTEGFVGPAHDIEHLVAAVRDVQAGRKPTPPAPPSAPAPALALPALTEREREVLLLLSAGASNECMAEALAISPHTVRTHVQNLLAKLGVQNRLAAVAIARRSGLLAVGA